MNKINKVLHNPWSLYMYAASKGLTNRVPDELHLKAMFRATIGKRLDLDNPVTFNEKLQWLKIHDRNPLYTTLVDKYRVKQWVADRIGTAHVTETYAMWERAEDIDISALPERFVLKTNHDSGGVAICRDRATFDFDAGSIEKLNATVCDAAPHNCVYLRNFQRQGPFRRCVYSCNGSQAACGGVGGVAPGDSTRMRFRAATSPLKD